MEYAINKGVGRNPEFKGLTSQYLFLFAGGLLSVFILFVILYMAGVDQFVCIAFGVIAGGILVWGTFYLNDRFGEFGLLKLRAIKSHPKYIINRLRIERLFGRSGSQGSQTLLLSNNETN